MSEDEKNVIRERSKNRYYQIKKIRENVDKIIRKEIMAEYKDK